MYLVTEEMEISHSRGTHHMLSDSPIVMERNFTYTSSFFIGGICFRDRGSSLLAPPLPDHRLGSTSKFRGGREPQIPHG
jgi:hypothetical protein